jgi:hypothetical protein
MVPHCSNLSRRSASVVWKSRLQVSNSSVFRYRRSVLSRELVLHLNSSLNAYPTKILAAICLKFWFSSDKKRICGVERKFRAITKSDVGPATSDRLLSPR